KEVLSLAEETGSRPLAARALINLASAENVAGRVAAALELSQQAIDKDGGVLHERAVLPAILLYYLGQNQAAIEFGRGALDRALETQDWPSAVLHESQIGLTLSSMGHYAQAQQAFNHALALGRKYEMPIFQA